MEWQLTNEEVIALAGSSCYYCGVEPNNPFNVFKTKEGSPRKGIKNFERIEEAAIVYNGVDRLDNDVGYITNNTVSCCKICNHAKHTQTVAEFFQWIEGLKTFLK